MKAAVLNALDRRLRSKQCVIGTFKLDQANEAVAHVAEHGGPFRTDVIRP